MPELLKVKLFFKKSFILLKLEFFGNIPIQKYKIWKYSIIFTIEKIKKLSTLSSIIH